MFEVWVGVDWGSESHQVCVLEGDRCEQRSVKHEGAALGAWVEQLLGRVGGQAERLAVAIETPHSAVVEALVERGVAVFSLNPKQLDRFRDRHTVGGAKDDRRDAFVLADSLRTDLKSFRRVRLGDEWVVQLRELSRSHDELLEEVNALGNRIDGLLMRYFPAVRALGSVHTEPWLWELLERAPSPKLAVHLPRAKVAKVLAQHHIRRLQPDEVLAAFRAPLHVAPGVAEACSSHLLRLLARLRLAHQQRHEGVRQMREALEQRASEDGADDEGGAEDKPGEHPDAAVVLSLPGVGTIVGAAILSEGWQPLQDRDYRRLRTLCGVAPITKQSGKQRSVSMRRACSPRLRAAVYHWARCSVQNDPHSRSHYAQLRSKGHSHGRALRGVADRLLHVTIAMLKSHSLYDPNRRHQVTGTSAPAPAIH